MVKINIAIKTKDRSPRKNFLRTTLENMIRAGVLESPHLRALRVVNSDASSDWAKPLPVITGPWVIDSCARTLHQNASRCIELASQGDADYAMVLEDDLDFCDDFLESVVAWLADHAVDGPQAYVLGASYSQIQATVNAGDSAWAYPIGAFYGAQALVWRREHATQLAEWLGPDPMYNGVRDHGHDLLLQKWGREQGLDHFIASAPCMVQHIGNESGIGNLFFQFPWGGRDWRYERRRAA
jgi:hypothetical protein